MRNVKLLALATIAAVMIFAMISGVAFAEEASTQTITDMAGRSVTIPSSIETLCATGQPGAVLLYTLCPEKLVAWNSELDEGAEIYIDAEIAALPVIGSMQGGKTSVNPEEVIALGPDVIIYMTTITSATSAKADEIQSQMGIPVVTVSFDILSLGETYRFLGEVLGCEEAAETLAVYCDTLISDIQEKAATIADEDKVTFYYTSGGNGLQTAPGGTSHSEMYELVGAVNVVDLEAESNGRLTVDMERILAWDPDVIITATPDLMETVLEWEEVSAVIEGAVYSAATLPFSWLDAPVSVNRLIGLCWAAETLYPDVYNYDITAYTQEFYSLFYGYDLTEAETEALLP